MPNYQAVLFFEDVPGSYGWSEVYYIAGSDAPDARDKCELLADARANILTDRHFIIAGRVSDVTILNDSLLTTNTPLTGAIVATGLTQVDPWSALNCRLEATSLHRGRKFFHGILEDTFAADRTYNPGNPNAAAWDTWFTYMINNCLLRYTVLGVPNYAPFTDAIPIREVEKKVGRPFALLRGRRAT